MRWLLVKTVDDANQRFAKYKCGRCGTTAELSLSSQSEPWPLPPGWTAGEREGWFICQGCETPRVRNPKPLQVIYQ